MNEIQTIQPAPPALSVASIQDIAERVPRWAEDWDKQIEAAQGLQSVTCKDDYELAIWTIKDLNGAIGRADEHYKPFTAAFHALHKLVVAEAKRPADKLGAEVVRLKGLATAWFAEQERRRKQEEDRLRREAEEAERKRRAEADRLAQEEAERRQKEAEALAAEGKAAEAAQAQAEASQIIEERAQESEIEACMPVYTPTLPSAAPKVAGASSRETWKCEVTDLPALIKAAAENPAFRPYLAAEQKLLDAAARSQKAAFCIPGCRAVVERGLAVGK